MVDFVKCAEHFPDLRHIILFNFHENQMKWGLSSPTFANTEQEAEFLSKVPQLTRSWTKLRTWVSGVDSLEYCS